MDTQLPGGMRIPATRHSPYGVAGSAEARCFTAVLRGVSVTLTDTQGMLRRSPEDVSNVAPGNGGRVIFDGSLGLLTYCGGFAWEGLTSTEEV